MQPHLFASERPPAIRLAALGDLGGAIGAALLAAPASPDRARSSAVQRRPERAPGGARRRAAAPGGRPRRGPRRARAARRAPASRRARARARSRCRRSPSARLASASIRVPARDQPRRDLRQPARDPRQPPAGVDGEDRAAARGSPAVARERGVVGGQRPAGRVARRPRARRVRRPGRASAIRSAASTLPSACARRLRRTSPGSAGRRPRCRAARGARATAGRSRGRARPSRAGRRRPAAGSAASGRMIVDCCTPAPGGLGHEPRRAGAPARGSALAAAGERERAPASSASPPQRPTARRPPG